MTTTTTNSNRIYRTKGIGTEVLDVDRNNLKLLLSTMEREDAHAEMFARGAFVEGIEKMKRADGTLRITCLRQHNWNRQIGKYKEIYESGEQLIGVAELGKTTEANDAFLDIESGILKECSTGTDWRSEVGHWQQKGDNQYGLWVIDKAVLYEASLVAVGANSMTGILATKSIDTAESELLKLKEVFVSIVKELYSGTGTDERLQNLEIHSKSVMQQIADYESYLTHKKSQEPAIDVEFYKSLSNRADKAIRKLS